MIGLAALGLERGTEVVTPACTFSTVVAPLEQLGLKPVFVDVEVGRYVPSVEAILGAITPRTGCLMLPNLIGSKPDWTELRRRLPKTGRKQEFLLVELRTPPLSPSDRKWLG